MFLGAADATLETQTEGNPNYVGYFNLPMMSHDHGGHHDMQRGVDIAFDITDQMKSFEAARADGRGERELAVSVVLEGSAEEFRCERVAVNLMD